MRPRGLIIVVLAMALLGACSGDGRTRGPAGVPAVMAAAGDSMTRALNVGSCCAGSDAPEYSWATGDNPAVDSHYRRLLRLNPSIREFNFARSGSTMADLDRQLHEAAAQPVDYLTILMGANDILGLISRAGRSCAIDPGGMTPVATFRAQFRRALSTFTTARPGAKIMVASVPDVPRLWLLFARDEKVLSTWDKTADCRLLVIGARGEATRRAAAARLADYNKVLGSVCASFKQCRFDGGATFRYPFQPADFSTVDYFHPSARGQGRLAAIIWRAGWWAKAG